MVVSSSNDANVLISQLQLLDKTCFTQFLYNEPVIINIIGNNRHLSLLRGYTGQSTCIFFMRRVHSMLCFYCPMKDAWKTSSSFFERVIKRQYLLNSTNWRLLHVYLVNLTGATQMAELLRSFNNRFLEFHFFIKKDKHISPTIFVVVCFPSTLREIFIWQMKIKYIIYCDGGWCVFQFKHEKKSLPYISNSHSQWAIAKPHA